MKLRQIFIVISFLFFLNVQAEVKLPRLISDGMVLQRETPLKIWGWASPGEDIVVKFKDKSYATHTGNTGKWELTLPAQKAGGPYEMQINDKVVKDILFGDVWLCSGQSNMDLPVRRTLDLYRDEVSNVNNPYIRLFRVKERYTFGRKEEDVLGGSWKAVTPENVLDFSAAAYFFGKELYDKYQVPIGLLNPSWGGTPIEAWISEDVIKKYPEYEKRAGICESESYRDSVMQSDKKKTEEWFSALNQKDPGVNSWFRDDTDTSDWEKIDLPGYWADKGVGIKNGSFWFCKEVYIPESMAGKEGEIRLGCIVDSDFSYINGVFVGTVSYQYPPRIYKIPAGLLKAGNNLITIRVINNSGKGGFVPDKPYKIIVGNEEVNLSGEWRFKMGAEMPPMSSTTNFQNDPTGLFNGMIAPLLNYNLKGVIWYQGESNTGKAAEYEKLLPDLIYNWRDQWHNPKLPFLYVQLANFMEAKTQPVESDWARLRESQRRALSVPYTGMAVAIDIGEWNDIHPLNKKELGRRLSLLARKIAYGDKKIVDSGPLYEKKEIRNDKIIVTFSSVGSGLVSDGELKEFAIAGADGKYVWAKAEIILPNKVMVWSDDVKNPVVVRYAWADNPDKANLKNKEGLPASPFTTE